VEVLTAEKLFGNICGGAKRDKFEALLRPHVAWYADGVARELGGRTTLGFRSDDAAIVGATREAVDRLPAAMREAGVYAYADKALALQPTIAASMKTLAPREFERVLHPVFEEDEVTTTCLGHVRRQQRLAECHFFNRDDARRGDRMVWCLRHSASFFLSFFFLSFVLDLFI